MAEPKCYQVTRAELAQHMREHYENVSKIYWCSEILEAIDAWEREPELKTEIERLQTRVKELEVQAAAMRRALERIAAGTNGLGVDEHGLYVQPWEVAPKALSSAGHDPLERLRRAYDALAEAVAKWRKAQEGGEQDG